MREGCLPDCLPPFSDLLRLLLRPPPEIKPVSLPFFEAGRGGGEPEVKPPKKEEIELERKETESLLAPAFTL